MASLKHQLGVIATRAFQKKWNHEANLTSSEAHNETELFSMGWGGNGSHCYTGSLCICCVVDSKQKRQIKLKSLLVVWWVTTQELMKKCNCGCLQHWSQYLALKRSRLRTLLIGVWQQLPCSILTVAWPGFADWEHSTVWQLKTKLLRSMCAI